MTKTAPEIPNKLFYKIGEVCEITDTQPYVLRFWESEFPQLAPRKNRSGQRVYQKKDIETVFRIKKLLYDEEYTIAGARKKLDEEVPSEKAPRAAAVEDAAAGRERQLVFKEPPPVRRSEVEEDHPVDVLAGRTGRAAREKGEHGTTATSSADDGRAARLERALAELKETLRETLTILKQP